VIPAPPPARPELASVSSRGFQSGVAGHVKLAGKNLADVSAVKTSHEKLSARLLAAESGAQVEIEITPAAELPRGRYEVWVLGPGGESNHLALHVNDLAQGAEIEPNNALAQATSVTSLPTDVWGVLAAKGDIDQFTFEAKAGQKLVFSVAAGSIGSKANIDLSLYDAAGRLLADINGPGDKADVLMAFTVHCLQEGFSSAGSTDSGKRQRGQVQPTTSK